ncbi:nif-specific transcriptional activator NifA [Methylotenera sp. G11]|uniref:nif-specific transcriptional activator NifA n=1 Tax=Methylotenera sp. G11 TaxID=1506585 RepID=UPI0006463EA8|nr:nif-specific transcriptional activator NifA [Methylotenera sp. G11]
MFYPSPGFNHIALITIYEISKILSTSLALDKTLRQTLNLIAAHLNMTRGMVCLIQASGQLATVASTGLTREEMQRGEFKMGEGITGKIFQHAIPAVIPDVANEPLFLNKTGAFRQLEGKSIAFLGVPIKVGTECIGVLSFQYEKGEVCKEFQPKLQLLIMAANLIGQTVRLNQKITTERHQLMQEKYRLQKDLANKYSLDGVIGQSKRMQEVFTDVHMAAPGNNTILLRGESGTGKEVIARSIHFLSPRKNKPFIKLNCAALTESLLESELFGHEKGAFTGALHHRKGRFEQAHGGTLFLDEIGDISPAFQVKLLRVLQEREFERVGGNDAIKIDVRLICATNRDLEQAVSSGGFRSDLYFRINVISIYLPPLRERQEDIPLLVENTLARFNKENNVKIEITPQALHILMNCQWPGNVRELENCVARFCTLSHSNLIQASDIPCQANNCPSSILWKHQPYPITTAALHSTDPIQQHSITSNEVQNSLPVNERQRMINAMEKSGWVQAKAARSLNLTPRQMGYALKKYKIDIKKL